MAVDAPSVGELRFLDGITLWTALENAAEQAGLGVYIAQLDQPPRILYVNPCAAKIVGREPTELIGQAPWSILRAEDRATVRTLIERTPGATPRVLELMVQRPNGDQIPITLAATRIQAPFGELSFGYFRDISLEYQTLDALRRSEARFRFLVEAAPDGVVILQRGDIVFINPKASELLGTDRRSALGQPISAFLPPADAAAAADRIAAMLRHGTEFPPSEYGMLADPNRVVEIKSTVCEWNGSPAVLAFARDITERKAIQRRLVESDRLAALGTLAAGVAHEINNPLTYAQLSAQRVARVLDTVTMPDEVRDMLRGHLDDIHHGIKRVASITHSLHSFVSQEEDVPGAVDVEGVITRALKMVDNELRHAARLVLDISSVPPVIGNASRLEQVLVNVLINAIKARPPQASTPHEIRVALAQSTDRVTITVADTGSGMPAAVRNRIFDPFFTTRDIGHGMGLGLSVSKSIVEIYGGDIEVDSTEGAGTTVRIQLRKHRGLAIVPPPAERPTRTPHVSGLRILVVDDEPMICEILKRILRDEHDVMIATSGDDALHLLPTHRFDLILCDVMMPGMNADDLYRRIATDHPGVERHIVFMSGGTLGPEVEDMLDGLPNERLAKPFSVDDVLELVARTPRTD
ncbi:MAG TPA: ATP-binding protein [Kofleriaceae bacterium]